MERRLDDGSRCLPKLSNLFTPGQSEIVLYPNPGPRSNLRRIERGITQPDTDDAIEPEGRRSNASDIPNCLLGSSLISSGSPDSLI